MLLFEAMQEIDDDVANPREITIETLWGCILTEGIFENCAEEVGNGAQVGGIDPNCIEGATGKVEFIAQPHIYVGDLVLRGLRAGPLR